MKRALVQSGGGPLGAYSAGVVKWLAEDGARWSIYAGISVGALNSALLSMYPAQGIATAVQKLLTIWYETTTANVWKPHRPFGVIHAAWRPSLYNSSPLLELIQKHFVPKSTKAAGNELLVSATSITSGRYRVFDQNYDDIVRAVWASAAFPVLFSPVLLDGEMYLDGGLRRATPLRSAIAAGAEIVDLVLTEPEEQVLLPGVIDNVADVASRVLPIVAHAVFEADIKLALKNNELAKLGYPGKREIKINIYRPKESLQGGQGVMEFAPATTRAWIEQGYEEAKAQTCGM